MKNRNNDKTTDRQESAGATAERALRELGQLRWFHVRCHALVALTVVSAALYGINYIFLADDVPYRNSAKPNSDRRVSQIESSMAAVYVSRCVVAECEAANSTDFSPPWLDAALPQNGRARRCSRRRSNPGADDACAAAAFGTELQPCERWLYASNDTIVAEVSEGLRRRFS
ncbi:hypothetical protein EVAR_96575_1 [Eumeta japonica]|uniref:Uncharacterized protein n=1 Tax=Eumeta variegata TaxID=151549 RepID=A0A4C1WUS9_EUMVA|nr:hypothetical protein EVAR_96575_1 [Eumeta japonica]